MFIRYIRNNHLSADSEDILGLLSGSLPAPVLCGRPVDGSTLHPVSLYILLH